MGGEGPVRSRMPPVGDFLGRARGWSSAATSVPVSQPTSIPADRLRLNIGIQDAVTRDCRSSLRLGPSSTLEKGDITCN